MSAATRKKTQDSEARTADESTTSQETLPNTRVWRAAYAVPSKHLKPITGKSYQGLSPRPQWIIQALTEMFGPVGIGWGLDILDHGVEYPRHEDGDAIHFAKVGLWYVDPATGQKSAHIQAIGGTAIFGKRRNGALFSDDDAMKKSVTDGLVKAASFLGVAGSVFMGDLDGNQGHETKYEESPEGSNRRDVAAGAPPQQRPRPNPQLSGANGRGGSPQLLSRDQVRDLYELAKSHGYQDAGSLMSTIEPILQGRTLLQTPASELEALRSRIVESAKPQG